MTTTTTTTVNPTPVLPFQVLPVISEYSASGSDYPKSYILSQGSGRFTGNLADPRQELDFVDPNADDPISGINFGIELAGFDGKGINKYYPSPKEYRYGTADGSTAPSGVFISYPPALGNPAYTTHDGSEGTGIFNFKKFISDFSNAPASKADTDGINNFTIFNDFRPFRRYPVTIM